MTGPTDVNCTVQASPDHAGWLTFAATKSEGYNASVLGPTLVRREGDALARVRITPRDHLANAMDNLHGGALLGFVDMSLFATLRVLTGRDPADAVTLDLSTQFIGTGRLGSDLDAVVELLRETGRLAFLRGTVEQEGILVASFSGTVRKLGSRG